MLDILDKNGKVVAVLMDDGSIIKKDGCSEDDITRLVKEALEKQKGK